VNEEKELPEGWVIAKINEIADVVSPGFPCGQYNTEGRGLPHLRPMNIDGQGRLCLDEIKYVDIADPPLLHSGDILFNNTNSPVWVGKTTVISQDNQFSFSNHMTRLSLNIHSGSPKFFALQLQHMQKSGFFLARCTNHVNQASISSGYLSQQVDLLMPPVFEQQRIVSAIEERFTILDAVTTALQQNKQKLKLARASVLKHAVEGKLTEKWRAKHPATESGSELLERILAERRAKWEAEQLAKGKDPRKLRYEEPVRPDVSELPDGWCWATVEQCFEVHVGATPSRKEPKYWNGNIAWVSSGEVQFCRIKSTRESITQLGLSNSSTQINPVGSVLIGIIGEGKTRGQVAILDIEASNNQNCAAIWVSQTPIIPEYIYYWLWSQYEIIRQGNSGNNQPALNQTKVGQILFPLPPLVEQQQIVAEIERHLSVIEQAEAAIETSLKRIERARQSILERAFSGRLVPQDPNDEPASVLLERIQEERTRRVVEGKQRGRNGGIKAAQGKKVKEQDFVPQWQLLKDAKESGSVDGSLSNASAREDGALERSEVGQGEMGKEELGDLVQMPLLSLWD